MLRLPSPSPRAAKASLAEACSAASLLIIRASGLIISSGAAAN
jgi:hypothetical protein